MHATGRSKINFFYLSIKSGRRSKKRSFQRFSFKFFFHSKWESVRKKIFAFKTSFLVQKSFFDSKSFCIQIWNSCKKRFAPNSGIKNLPGALRAPDLVVFPLYFIKKVQIFPGALRAPDCLYFLCILLKKGPKFSRRASRAGFVCISFVIY